MWSMYSAQSIRDNKVSSLSVAAATLLATLLLSLLCSLLYNVWVYDIQKIVAQEGDWQARVSGAPEKANTETVLLMPNVDRASVNADVSDEDITVIDIVFKDARAAFTDAPLIARELGLDDGSVQYHLLLLSRYLIHDPNDPEPPMLLAFYIAILLIVAVSLVLIIHNAFAVGMNARVHQFGILSSVGATPGQIRACLMQEAATLCALPALVGCGLGVAASVAALSLVNRYAGDVASRQEAVFALHPAVFAATLLAAFLTVALSAWIPARRLSRLTPLQAIRGFDTAQMKRKRHARVLSLVFGIEGELAGNALKANKKALRASTLSLTLSFLAFTVMMCFTVLSGISTNHTYFERYQDAWDIMFTLPGAKMDEFALASDIRALPGVRDAAVYQKTTALSAIPESWQSEELASLGGLSALSGKDSIVQDGTIEIAVPIVVLDDASFLSYCGQIGVEPGLDGAIALNRVWNSKNSSFRYKTYVPFVTGAQSAIGLRNRDGASWQAELPIRAFAQEPPILREEYENYALVQFVPSALWNGITQIAVDREANTYVRVLAEEGATAASLDALQAQIARLIGRGDPIEGENRIREKLSDEQLREGQMVILGSFCVLLAAIGIANVFFYTLSFLRQRKREFARYLSVGMDDGELRKLFAIEALVIAGRPILVTLPITLAALAFFIRASHLDPAEFLAKAPVAPIACFMLAIFGFVALAYALGARRLLACSLAEALRDER